MLSRFCLQISALHVCIKVYVKYSAPCDTIGTYILEHTLIAHAWNQPVLKAITMLHNICALFRV